MSALILNGTRVQHYLSGDHDSDYFKTEDDMSESHWDLLMSCHHRGSCDDDTEEAARYFEIKDYKAAFKYLVDAGIERENLLDEDDKRRKDESKILQYYLWILAGDIQDRMKDEQDDERKQYQNYDEA